MEQHLTSLDEVAEALGPYSSGLEVVDDRLEIDLRLRQTQLSDEVSISSTDGRASGILRAGTTRVTDEPDLVVLEMVYGEDTTHLHQLGRAPQSEIVQRGQGIMYDLRRPLITERPSWADTLAIEVDRNSLVAATGGRLPLLTAIPVDSSLMRLLASMAREALAVGDDLNAFDAQVFARTTVDLLGALALSRVENHEINPSGRQALLCKILADIEDRLGDPDLSPPNLAARHHVSLRYFHNLFHEIDTTAAAYIRERRLRRAEAVLGDASQAGTPVGAIAYAVGFNDPSTFVRAFRRRFGMTPTDRRAAGALAVMTTIPRRHQVLGLSVMDSADDLVVS